MIPFPDDVWPTTRTAAMNDQDVEEEEKGVEWKRCKKLNL